VPLSRALHVLAFHVPMVFAIGCGELLDVSSYVVVDRDAAQSGTAGRAPDHAADTEAGAPVEASTDSSPGEDPDWGCLGSVEWPVPPGEPFEFTLQVYRNNGTGIPDLDVSACYDGRPNCADPVVQAGQQVTDERGTAVLSLSTPGLLDGSSVFGHLRVTDPAGTYPPHLFYFFPPPVTTRTGIISAYTRAEMQDHAGGIAVLDRERGAVGFLTWSCTTRAVRGVAFDIDSEESAYYGAAVIPGLTETDSSGVVRFFNVAPGRHTITGTVVASGRSFGSVVVQVDADSWTIFDLKPR
jgi:hypothetical protein